ncbi:SDR family oxidoreductase [Arthrobacter tecti]
MNHSPESGPRITLVTGAGSGIGRAVAHAFLEAGYAVVLAGRRREPLEQTAQGWELAQVVPTDISKHDDVGRLFAQVRKRWGRLDVLFNNAGIFGPAGAVDEVGLEEWSSTVAVNITGSFLCAAEAFRLMKEQDPQGGRIINNGSIAAHSPRPRSAAYTTTKHAITGLTKSIELDGRPYGITCGQIDIGNTHTDLMDTLGVGEGALQADGSRRVEPTFPVEEAARTVLHMVQLPASASIGTVVMTASGMPFIGRG